MPQSDSDSIGSFDLARKVQFSGYLLKRSDASGGNKWQKRFCIVKDGFLLCYKEEDALRMRKMNVYVPKAQASYPLSDCSFREINESGHPFSIEIENSDFSTRNVILSAENERTRSHWLNQLQSASKISFQTVKMTDQFIRQLEDHGVAMANEKDHYMNMINEGAEALETEKRKNLTLQRVKQTLENEKRDMEQYIEGLKEEQDNVKQEMEETLKVMVNLKKDKELLEQRTHDLQSDLHQLDKERKETEAQFRHSQQESELSERLADIEAQTASLRLEKERVEARLQEKDKISRILEEEKLKFSEQARELQDSLKDLVQQKNRAERELQTEIRARMEAEQRLREAEMSLGRLHANITEGGQSYTVEEKAEMTTDVRKLKSEFTAYTKNLKNYFESLIESNNPNSTAKIPGAARSECLTGAERSLMVRARSLRLREKHRSRLSTLGCPPPPNFEEESFA